MDAWKMDRFGQFCVRYQLDITKSYVYKKGGNKKLQAGQSPKIGMLSLGKKFR